MKSKTNFFVSNLREICLWCVKDEIRGRFFSVLESDVPNFWDGLYFCPRILRQKLSSQKRKFVSSIFCEFETDEFLSLVWDESSVSDFVSTQRRKFLSQIWDEIFCLQFHLSQRQILRRRNFSLIWDGIFYLK